MTNYEVAESWKKITLLMMVAGIPIIRGILA